jgi:hypothetical protein
MTTTARVLLFLSSYSPLGLIAAVRVWELDSLIASGLVVISLFAFAAAWFIQGHNLRAGSRRLEVETAEPIRDASAAYLTAYVLPFLLVDLSDTFAVIASVLFVVLIGVVYVRSRLVYLNPIYALRGYVLWKATGTLKPGDNHVTLLLLSQGAIADGSVVQVARVDEETWIARAD